MEQILPLYSHMQRQMRGGDAPSPEIDNQVAAVLQVQKQAYQSGTDFSKLLGAA